MLGFANKDVSREIIRLARLGGLSIRDKYPAKDVEAAAAEATKSQKAVKGRRPSNAKASQQGGMVKSQSMPTLAAGGSRRPSRSTFQSTRRGGGWTQGRDLPVVDLSQFTEKLDYAKEWSLDIDFCEKPYFRTALWEATWKNHEAVVRLLIDRGASVSTADFQKRTPLHEAAYYGHLKLVELFIERGHPIDCEDIFGQTPLFRAVEGGRHDVVKYLVEHGAKSNRLDGDSLTVQHLAAFRGMSVMSDYLLVKGARKNRFAIEELSPLAAHKSKRAAMPLLSGGSLVLGGNSSL
mmetsp:Transcript_126546/g.236554  ORF Transcript_126546/g.236554 Transcript_126546/m.236554 type:complete len:293 (-) Transcript_126546:50-928(-)